MPANSVDITPFPEVLNYETLIVNTNGELTEISETGLSSVTTVKVRKALMYHNLVLRLRFFLLLHHEYKESEAPRRFFRSRA
jgi:hypothetical protein